MKETLGKRIARLRKEKSMTQMALADKMGVTDKAVSKWERDLSCPDISTLPNLARILEVSVEELMQAETKEGKYFPDKVRKIMDTVWKGVAMAMGIAVVVLSVLGELELQSGMTMLGVGLSCTAFYLFSEQR